MVDAIRAPMHSISAAERAKTWSISLYRQAYPGEVSVASTVNAVRIQSPQYSVIAASWFLVDMLRGMFCSDGALYKVPEVPWGVTSAHTILG